VAQRQTEDPGARALLEGLAKEEQGHCQRLKKLKEQSLVKRKRQEKRRPKISALSWHMKNSSIN